MRVLLDTNVVLDVLLERKPFFEPAAEVFALAEQSMIEGFLCATTVTTIDYLLGETLPDHEERQTLWRLLSLFEIAVVNRSVIEAALRSKTRDFEDAVLDHAAQLAGAEVIITRNTRDFSKSPLRIVDAAEFLAEFRERQSANQPSEPTP